MAYIPPNAEWYLADIVLELKAEGADGSQVWVITHLIRAGSPEEAYTKAEAIGNASAKTYVNTAGGQVGIVYRGLLDLEVIYERLEDGKEIRWRQYDDLTSEEVHSLVTPREELAVFAPIDPETDPRFVPKELL